MLRTAAKLTMFHGTCSGPDGKILRSILKEGLLPDPKAKAYQSPYGEDEDDYGYDGIDFETEVTMRLDESLGGAYLTTQSVVAKDYAVNACGTHGGRPILVSAQIETRTPEVHIDEDFLVNYVWGFVEERFAADDNDSYYFELYEWVTEGDVDWEGIARQWIEKSFPGVKIHEKRWAQVLPAMAKSIKSIMIIELLRNYERDIEDVGLEKDEYFELDAYYDIQDALDEHKEAIEFVSDRLREVATPTKGGMHNIRILKPVGYRGANRIKAVVSWRHNYGRDYAQVGVLHYARTKADGATLVRIAARKHSRWTDGQGNVLYDNPVPEENVASARRIDKRRDFGHSTSTEASHVLHRRPQQSSHPGAGPHTSRILRRGLDAAERTARRHRERAASRRPGGEHRALGESGARSGPGKSSGRPSLQLHHLASDFGDRYGFDQWVDLSSQDLRNDPELLDELFSLIGTAYGKDPHKNYSQPLDLLQGNLTVHAINLDEDPEPDALLTWKDKPAGNKLDSMGHDGGRDAKLRVLQEFQRLLGSAGFFTEVSGAPAAMMLRDPRWADVVVVEDPEMVQAVLPGKKIQWHGEHPDGKLPGNGWFTRDIGGGPATKIIVGLPRVTTGAVLYRGHLYREALTPQQKEMKRDYLLEQAQLSDKIPSFEDVYDDYLIDYGDYLEDEGMSEEEFRDEVERLYDESIHQVKWRLHGVDVYRGLYDLYPGFDPYTHNGLGVFWSLSKEGVRNAVASDPSVIYHARADESHVDQGGTVWANSAPFQGPVEEEVRFHTHAPIYVYGFWYPNGDYVEIDDWRRC